MQIFQNPYVPYNGYVWDHPIRKHWREQYRGFGDRKYEDPVFGQKPWLEGLKRGVPFILLVFAFFNGIALSQESNPEVSFMSRWILVEFIATTVSTFVVYLFFASEFVMARKRFDECTGDIARAIGVYGEDLVSWKWDRVRDAADEQLIERAIVILEAEAKWPDEPCSLPREEAKEEFSSRMRVLEPFSIPRHADDHGWYFRKARERLYKKQ